MSKIEFDNVSLTFVKGENTFLALENINLHIQDGEFVCLIGPSGCGKSTLISLLAGLNFPTEGQVRIDGDVVRGCDTTRSIVFQHYSLFPWLSAKKNVMFGIHQAKRVREKKEIEERALEFLRRVGLIEYANEYPYQLSGGMQQRVAIARTLAMDSDILLLDEPFGAVDPKNRVALQDLTVALCKHTKNQKAVVFVTHDIDEAILLADRIVFMEPKHIADEIRVNFPKDWTRERIARSKQYADIRSALMALFYQDVSEKIGGEEVYL